MLQRRMRKLSYTYQLAESNIIVDSLGINLDMVELEIDDMEPVLRIIRCPHCKTCEDVAKTLKVGIEKVWYDFRNHTCRLCKGVKKEIKCSVVKVDDIVIEDNTPTDKEASEISSVLKRMQHFHAQGFVFENYPKIIPY